MKRIGLFCFLFVFAVSQSSSLARTFTNASGASIEAEVVEIVGDKVVLSMKGKNYPVPIASLSKEDQDFLKAWSAKKETPEPGKAMAGTLGDFDGVQLGNWPSFIESGDEGKEYQINENEDGSYTYQSPHFEFHVPERLSISVVREFARIFEATYQFLDQAPFGLAPSPAGSGKYQTHLFKTRADYQANGGPANSGGVFTYSYSFRQGGNPGEIKFNKALIKIPMPSLGVEYTGTRYIIDHDKRNTTLIHEIVHQVMMRWLPVMPTWMSEGFAEFVESQDYSKGRYKLNSMVRSVKEKTPNAREFTMVPLERLMTISGREWSAELGSSLSAGRKNYASAKLLLTYFAMLEGNGKGEALVEYLKAVSSGVPKEEAAKETLLKGRSYAEMEAEVVEKWKKEGVRITFN